MPHRRTQQLHVHIRKHPPKTHVESFPVPLTPSSDFINKRITHPYDPVLRTAAGQIKAHGTEPGRLPLERGCVEQNRLNFTLYTYKNVSQ